MCMNPNIIVIAPTYAELLFIVYEKFNAIDRMPCCSPPHSIVDVISKAVFGQFKQPRRKSERLNVDSAGAGQKVFPDLVGFTQEFNHPFCLSSVMAKPPVSDRTFACSEVSNLCGRS